MSSEYSIYSSVPEYLTTEYSQSQGHTFASADAQCAKEINMDVVRHLLWDQKDLVKKITGVSRLRIYEGITNKIKALKHNVNPDSNSLQQWLYSKACEWFEPAV
ncbi:hypothetical protein IWQ61_010561, partial [Dispira simplex]